MKIIVKLAAAGIALLLLVQVVPYGRNHTNPPVVREPVWDSPATRELVKRACFNCHSHETVWPWYSTIAPASWLVYRDVTEARKKLNFSDWKSGGRPGENPVAIRQEVSEGEMPPFQYLLAHPEAKLTDAERKQLIDGMKATFTR